MEATPIEFLGYVAAAVPVALALDWACYVRLLDSLIHLGEVRNNARWSRTMVPRTIYTVAAGALTVVVMIGIAPAWLIWVGCVVFLAGQFHAIARVLADRGTQ